MVSPTTSAHNAWSRLARLVRALSAALPSGNQLPADAWDARHRWVVTLLWAHAVGIAVFALAAGRDALDAAAHGAVIAGLAALAAWPRMPRRGRAAVASFALVTTSALIVHLWGGTTEAHFHFFVVVSILMLYQDWAPFGIALVYVVVHHGAMGVASPHDVYGTPEAIADPWRWAAVHAAFVLAASAANVVTWRANERLLGRLRVEGQYASLFGSSMFALVTGEDGRITDVNDAFVALTGRAADELRGVRAGDLYPAEYAPLIERAVLDARGGGSCAPFECELLAADGTRIPVLIGVATVDRRPWRWVCFVLDRTEQRRVERAHQGLLAHMLGAESRERTRIAHELHDDSIQVMAASVMRLDLALAAVRDGDGERAERGLEATREVLGLALDRTRHLTFELHPPLLYERGVGAAIAELADELAGTPGGPARVDVDVEGVGRHSAATEELVYRTVLEALTNVRKHAGAATVAVSLREEGDAIHGEVRDDGRGFVVDEALDRSAHRLHLGLASTLERVRLAGGVAAIDSAPALGTTVAFSVPFIAVGADASADASAASRP
jgi:PAS domain S-box-containing protein